MVPAMHMVTSATQHQTHDLFPDTRTAAERQMPTIDQIDVTIRSRVTTKLIDAVR